MIYLGSSCQGLWMILDKLCTAAQLNDDLRRSDKACQVVSTSCIPNKGASILVAAGSCAVLRLFGVGAAGACSNRCCV